MQTQCLRGGSWRDLQNSGILQVGRVTHRERAGQVEQNTASAFFARDVLQRTANFASSSLVCPRLRPILFTWRMSGELVGHGFSLRRTSVRLFIIVRGVGLKPVAGFNLPHQDYRCRASRSTRREEATSPDRAYNS